MKSTAIISGIAAANLTMFGSLFKIFQWPLANVLLVIATLIFCFIFLPSAIINWYGTFKQKSILLPVATFLAFFTGALAILFRVMHWKFGMPLLMFALPLPYLLFLPAYLIHTRAQSKDRSFIPVMMGLTFIAVFGVLLAAK